jgi:hypothetical protein
MYLPEDPDQPTPAQETEDMDINDLAPPTGDAVSLEIGQVIEGVLEHVGDWRPSTSKFNPDRPTSPWLLVTDDGENRTLWVDKGSRLATVLGGAMREAGLKDVQLGGRLKLGRTDDVDTGKGNPMKDYRARYTPAPQTVKLDGLDDGVPTAKYPGTSEPF